MKIVIGFRLLNSEIGNDLIVVFTGGIGRPMFSSP